MTVNMETSEKRFDEWTKVDCNDCGHYWDSSCDGVPKDSTKPCNSYLATRSVVIPAKIKALEKRVESLRWCTAALALVMMLHIILSHILGL